MLIHRRPFHLVLLIVISFSGASAWSADEEQLPDGKFRPTREYHILTGVLLPNQIDGVTEQSGGFGARMAWAKKKDTWIEPGFMTVNAYGVRYYNVWMSYRMDIDVDTLVGHIYIGGDVHRYTRPVGDPVNGYQEQTDTNFGGHIGGGISAPINEALWFRSDMKFNLNPGTALFVSFSLMFRLDASKDSGTPGSEQAPR